MNPSIRYPQLAAFIASRALKTDGPYTLASGKTSPYYIDGRLISYSPQGNHLIVEAILDEISSVEFDAIGGMESGATPIIGGLANRLGMLGRDVPTFNVRKKAKEHGTGKRIDGPLLATPCRTIIVEDTVTSGGSILDAINVLRQAGHKVVLALSVVDRNEGGAELLAKHGVPYRPLVTLSDLGIDAPSPSSD